MENNNVSNIDIEILDERNEEMKKIEKDILELKNIYNEYGQILSLQTEDINKIENTFNNIKENINVDFSEIKEEIDNTHKKLIHVIGGAVVGGLIFGGIGSIFGPIAILISGASGLGLGTISGILFHYFNEK